MRRFLKFEVVVVFLIGLVALLFAMKASASQPFGGQYYPKKGQCVLSYPMKMMVVAKTKNFMYLVAQGVSVFNPAGAIEIKSHQPHENEVLNIGVQYVGSKDVMGSNGFMKSIDLWKECTLER